MKKSLPSLANLYSVFRSLRFDREVVLNRMVVVGNIVHHYCLRYDRGGGLKSYCWSAQVSAQ
jgi:hypothetical protein